MDSVVEGRGRMLVGDRSLLLGDLLLCGWLRLRVLTLEFIRGIFLAVSGVSTGL